MKTFKILGLAIVAILLCLSACSEGDDPIQPTPKPEIIKSEITIDSSITTNGLSFTYKKGEQSISFSTNENWTLSVASTTSGTTWCTASLTSGIKGNATVKFNVSENTSYDNRSISVTIKSGTASKTFTISQKGIDAMLVTTDKYEISQEGGTIEIEVKANISYQMEISEESKSWITESSGRSLTSYKHTLNIDMNKDSEKREGKVYFKSGNKVETIKIYQSGNPILLLSQNEFNVSDQGDTISIDIHSNVDFGVQMPNVDWIVDEASSRGLSSHTLKYIVKANEQYDNRSAEIVFFDKNNNLKDTVKIVQVQKDVLMVSEKNFSVDKTGGIIEVKLKTNIDFEVKIPSDVTWITKIESRALTEKSFYLKVTENTEDDTRNTNIIITDKNSQLDETITIIQEGIQLVVSPKNAGKLKSLLGTKYLDIVSLKIVGFINGDDIYYLRKMLGAEEFSQADRGKLVRLDLSNCSIVDGGGWYYENPSSSTKHYTSNDTISDYMFYKCYNLQKIVLPDNITSINEYAFAYCVSLTSINIPARVNLICKSAFRNCTLLTSAIIGNNVSSIDEYAFAYCTSLNIIKIPNNVTSIGNDAFSHCI